MKNWDLILFFDDGREEKCMQCMPVPEVCGKNEKDEIYVIQPAVMRAKGLIAVQRRGEEKIFFE
jgi:hypothetical protein